MKINFSTKEFCITGEVPPFEVIDKLWKYHILPMQAVRDELNAPITASSNSGYRPKEYELSKGRSGNSQHTFQDKGAVDWTAENLDELLRLIMELTHYTRVAVYRDQHFIHCDYKATDGKRYLFESNSASQWTFKKNF